MNIREMIQKDIERLFAEWSGEKALTYSPLTGSGSNREYYRISGKTKKALGVFNPDIKENKAFFHFTEVFLKNGLKVPELFITSTDKRTYLVEDLGNQTLFNLKTKEPSDTILEDIKTLYKKSLTELLKFQFIKQDNIDFNLCYPRKAMDRQSFQWDLNYFKYYFLKPQNILFDEEKLENDFSHLADLLLEAQQNYFIYRDFQARNIMIHNNTPYFIDYQGGRKGALQYDLASIIYQVKAKLPETFKEELIDHYWNELLKYENISKKDFLKHFYPYIFIRLTQVLGAYGFRGLIEKRTHFVESIPFAVKSLRENYHKFKFLEELPELAKIINHLIQPKQHTRKSSKLLVKIKSFAYKSGIPKDDTGHGEGFVFDCRSLPNPGRHIEYQHLSGLDEEVKDYLKQHREVLSFIDHIQLLVDQAVENYIERSFTNLNINFGCTGGQHRSVYFTETIASHLKEKYDIKIELTHTQEKNWKLKNENS